MEVHHHAHPSTGSGHRKKWTHYFWEFLMLFLAVFCGFLAEYKLEHMIEHSKEKQYMRSMLEDLHQDTTEISRAVQSITDFGLNCDTILNLLETSNRNDPDSLKSLYLLHYSLGADIALLSQRTMAQLKNSGGLRLIRERAIADSISLYDNRSQYLTAVFKSYDETSTRAYDSGIMIFDNQFVRHRFTKGTVRLLSSDEMILRKYANCIYTYQGVGKYYRGQLRVHKDFAVQLMQLIENRYHLN